jgi:molecular chaperone HscB
MNKESKCYNCQAIIKFNDSICPKCNFIQAPKDINLFDYLDIKQDFVINLRKLEEKYLKLQIALHPDRIPKDNAVQQNYALIHASKLNIAFETLKSDLKRAVYLLELQNIKVNSDGQDDVKADGKLLAEIFQLQEEISEADDDKQESLINNIKLNEKKTLAELEQAFKANNYLQAAQLCIKLRYLEKSLNDLDGLT